MYIISVLYNIFSNSLLLMMGNIMYTNIYIQQGVEMQEVDYLLMWAIIMYVRTTIVNHLHFTN